MNVQIVYSGKTFGNPHNKIFETLMGIQEPEHDPNGQRVLHQLELGKDIFVRCSDGRLYHHTALF